VKLPRRFGDPLEVYPVMGRLAIALREKLEFRFWSLLLDLARKTGRRVNHVTVSLDDLSVLGIESVRTLNRYVDRASQLGYVRSAIYLGGGYWRVYFTGQLAMNMKLRQRAESAGVMNSDEWDRRKVFIAAADFASIARFEGAVFAGWVSVAKGNQRRATWAVLQDMWGVTRPAMEHWIASVGTVKRFENWGNVDAESIVHLTTQAMGETHIQQGKYKRSPRTFFQRGNTWHTSPDFAARGLARQMFSDVQIDQPTMYAGEGAAKRLRSTRHSDDLIRATKQMLTTQASEARTNFDEWRTFDRESRYRPSETLYYAQARYIRRSGKAVQIWHCAPAVVS
jgi:hypothetical protein